MRENKVKIKNKMGEELVGIEVLPNEESKFPVVILVHGFHYFKEEDGMFIEISKRLTDIGIGSYLFDFSGCGESEGDYSNTSLSKLRNDLESIMEFVKSKRSTDILRLGILAQSFGTTVTVALSPHIKSLVLMGAFINPKQVFQKYFGTKYNPDGITIKHHDDGRITTINAQFWQDFKNYDMVSLLKNMHSPLLLIYGSNDETVPISSIEDVYKNANDPKEKIIIGGADHGLQPKRDEVYTIVTKWFKKTLF